MQNITQKVIMVDIASKSLPTLQDILALAREHSPEASTDAGALTKYIKHYEIVVKRTASPELEYRVKLARELRALLSIKEQEFSDCLLKLN
jgi:hypothetical protein